MRPPPALPALPLLALLALAAPARADDPAPLASRLEARDWPELRGLLADVAGVDLGPAAALGAGRWVVQARVEVNPVSHELLERTRESIGNPGSGVRGGAPSRSVLGAMASDLFRGSESSEAHLFACPPFTAAEVRAP